MKTLYLECNMGAAGDMLMAALLELTKDPDAFVAQMNSLGIPGVHVASEPMQKCGIFGTHMHVHVHGEEEVSEDVHLHEHHHHNHDEHTHEHEHTHDHHENHHEHHHHENSHEHTPEHEHTHDHHEHHHDHDHHEHSHDHGHEHHHHHDDATPHVHNGMHDIAHVLSHLPVSQSVRANALAVYQHIANAESKAHGKPVDQVHFHEVGAMDAVADVVGVCLLMEQLGVERVVVSPVHVGSGHVRCAHGVLPVPAPATAHILMGVPFYSGAIKGELCTPTGAALLRHFSNEFGAMPAMTVEKIGYGMGKKDFEAANCVRAFLGQTADDENAPNETDITELSCNLDDVTGEALGYATQLLLDEGARDVYTVPIYMKKNRPAQMLVCLCDTARADEFAMLMLKHTPTIGVRRTAYARYTLERHTHQVQTPYGTVRVKVSEGYGIKKAKPEYDDVCECAKKHHVAISQVLQAVHSKEF